MHRRSPGVVLAFLLAAAPASWSLDPKSVDPATLRAAVLIGRLLQTTN